MMKRGFLLFLSLALCATTMALIIVSVSTNTWVQQDFAFNDGTGASGTYVIGVLRFCVNLNPNPYYQSACGLVDATCFTDVGTVVAAYFPACTHFNLFRILITLSLGFTILTLISYLFLLAISHPRIAHMSIIFSILSMLCGLITMSLFITYQGKLSGKWIYGSSFWMIVVAWPLMFLSIITSSLLHFIYPPSGGQFSPSKSDPKNRAENERKRQAAVAQKEKKEAEKRDKALVALEKKRQAAALSKPTKIDTGATELVPLAPPLSSTAAPTPTYSPVAEPSQSNSTIPIYSQNERILLAPNKIPTPRDIPDITTTIQPTEYKHHIPIIPPLITHPTSLTHFSSSPQLQPTIDTTSTYLVPTQQPISPRTSTPISPRISTSPRASLSPRISTSPRGSTNEKNEKKEKKRNKSLLSAMTDDDPMAAADWWINHNQQIHQQHQRQTLLLSQAPETRPHTASEYEENPLLGVPIPGAPTHTTPIQQATPATSDVVPFRLPPRTTDQKSPTPSPRTIESPPTTQTSAYTYGTPDYNSYQQQQQDLYDTTLQSYQQQTAHHATLNQQNLGVDEHVQLYDGDDMGTSSGYATPGGGIAPGYYRATSTTTTYDQQHLADGSMHYSHTQHQTEYVSTTPPSYDYGPAFSQYPPPPPSM